MTVQSLFQTVNLLSLKSTRLGIFIALYEFILMQTPLKKMLRCLLDKVRMYFELNPDSD